MPAATNCSRRCFWRPVIAVYLLSICAVCTANRGNRVEIVDVSGRYFELKCPGGRLNADIEWLKDGRSVYASDAFQENRAFELRDGNLLVVDSKESDSGVYTCTLSTGAYKENHVDIQNSELEDVCGIANHLDFRARVFGGDESREGEWPWMAMIRKTSTGEFCGGSLLDHYWVVTSAQCVRGISLTSQNTRVYLGKLNRELNEAEEVMVEVESIFVHPNYNDHNHDADIALVRLKSLVQFNDRVSPVCLPPAKTAERMIDDRRVGWATGWGATEHEQLSHSLRKVKLKVTYHWKCEQGHTENSVTSNMFCADSDHHTRDTCTGDTGGPFVRKIGTRWYLLGIISWGQHCASHQPGVFTRVDKFHDWIKETQRNVFSCNSEETNPHEETTVEDILQSPISAEGCGLIGNGESVPNSSPWLVQILRRQARARFAESQDCNGVLLGNAWVATLASCFPTWNRNQISVKLTSAAFHQRSNAPEYSVSDVVIHPGYSEMTRENDIVLLKLAVSIGSTDFATPACVLKPDFASMELENRVQGFVTGIGNVNSLQPPSDETVQTIPFAVNTTDSCNRVFYGGVTNSMFCATTMSPTEDACGGFRGSPIMIEVSGRWYVLGLVSWGHMCHVYPVVFTNLHNYNDWMLDVVQNTGR